jgi:hypothetical protein
MFRHAKRERDIERNAGQGEVPQRLNFEDPSWILDHHRHNLILKIAKPKSSAGVLGFLWSKRSARSTETYNNQSYNDQKPRGGQNQDKLRDNHQPATENPNHGLLEESQQSYRINFCELQRLHLRQLQHKLVQHVVHLTYKAREPSGWAEDLRQYGEYNISQHQCYPPSFSSHR